ncbi:MAG: hypothetical protein SAJ37_21135 [Oscillatoria sp. PMC 1068.18]|nr:hypothetical protein [Oscillatoria sp. PMC 1068.18]
MPLQGIPPRYQAGIRQLIILDNEIISQILNALTDSIPCLNISQIAESVALKSGYGEIVNIEEILKTIIALYSLRNTYEISIQELVHDVIEAISITKELDELSLDEQNKLQERLSSFLQIDHIFGVMSKAIGVMTEQSNLFLHSRILTDIRPVFNVDSESEIVGVVVIHNLKIEYRHEDKKKEFFVALDRNDIRELQNQLERAINKTESMKFIFEKAEIRNLDVEY